MPKAKPAIDLICRKAIAKIRRQLQRPPKVTHGDQ